MPEKSYLSNLVDRSKMALKSVAKILNRRKKNPIEKNPPAIYFHKNTSSPNISAPSSVSRNSISSTQDLLAGEQKDLKFSDDFEAFCADLSKLNTPKERAKYIAKLTKEEAERDPNNQISTELVTDNQLNLALDFIFKNKSIIEHDLSAAKASEVRIARKDKDRDNKYKGKGELPFTLEIQRNDDRTISVYFLTKSKIGEKYADKGRKHHGASKSVSPRILLNPQNDDVKLLDTISKKTHDVLAARREGKLLTAVFGSKFKIGKSYIDSKNKTSVNTSELAAVCDLSQFVNPHTRAKLLAKDKTYDRNNHVESEEEILTKLIGDVLGSIKRVHDTGIIHNDNKDGNVLVFVDPDGRLRAQVADFDFGVYKNKLLTNDQFESQRLEVELKLDKSQITYQEYEEEIYNLTQDLDLSRPVATSCYAAPQVAGYTVQRVVHNMPIIFLSLYDAFTACTLDRKHFKYYGAQIMDKLDRDWTDKDNCVNLMSSQKDDMFSLGITLFMLITGHYPCADNTFDKNEVVFSVGNPAYNLKYLDLDSAVLKYPLMNKFEPLIRQLLAPTREARLDSISAEKLFKELYQNHQDYKIL